MVAKTQMAQSDARVHGPPARGHRMVRSAVLGEADRIVSGDRGKAYGHPRDDFGRSIGMALALWGRGPETPGEHALYMILVKISRLATSPDHRDSLVDIAGYVKTYEMILDADA